MRLLNHLLGLLLMLVIAGDALAGDTDANTQAAESAVREWLALTDAGKTDESLAAASAYFQARVDAENWRQAMKLSRAPLGETRKRELDSAEATTNIPGGPDGEYVVFKFNTAFANKQQSVETVTMVLEDDHWRVIGYYIL